MCLKDLLYTALVASEKSKVSIYWEVNASNVTVPLLAFDDRASRSSPLRKLGESL